MGITSCSGEEEGVKANADSKNVSDVIYCFNLSEHLDKISSLDSLESIDIPIDIIGDDTMGKTVFTRAGNFTPIVGTITNLGNQKTLFKYGVGDNLVPRYYCGTDYSSMTISTVYRVSVRYDLDDSYDVKGDTGDNSGWTGRYVYNPQTKYQGKTGDTTYTELFTFVYDIKSTVQGYSAGEHCWIPTSVDNVRIYARILH